MSSEREYVLKWHSFSSTIQGVFRRLLEDSAFADVTLAVENKQLPCHRLVLSACSTYFETLLTAHPHSHPIIILHDIPHSVVQALIKFMYSGEIRLPQNQLQCFLKVAETLRIKGLTETDGKPKSAPAPESSPEGHAREQGHAREPGGTDVTPPPPLIPAVAPVSATTPTTRSAPAAAPAVTTAAATASVAASWTPAPATSTKRRSPEPSHELRDERDTPPREQAGGMSAKRRRSTRGQGHVAPSAEPEPEQEPVKEEPLELKVEREPEPEPMEEAAEPEDERSEQPEQEESVASPKTEPASGEEDADPPEGEEPDEDDEEEEEDEEQLRRTEERRLEEDIELVSGDTTQDGPAPSPEEQREEQRVHSPPSVSNTVQAASEAAASTLMDSCGQENAPWKDGRWSSLLPEEKVMEAMGNMLDVPTLAAKLMKNLFTEEERISSNTTGDHGKQIFDREKMDLIKSIVFHVSKVDREDQFARDDLWVRCKMKIDKWNRDLRYARKKKDKDTSLPTMVKLDYSTTGRGDDDWERETGRGERGGVSLGGLGAAWLGGLGSPPVTPQCSADV